MAAFYVFTWTDSIPQLDVSSTVPCRRVRTAEWRVGDGGEWRFEIYI